MMKGKRLISLTLVLIGLWAGGKQGAFAQEEQSIFGEKMQSRYIPSHEGFKGNFFISTTGSYRRWMDQNMGAGPMVGVAFGKWFTPLHGARIEAGTGYFLDIERNARVKILPDVRASYLFNLSAFLDGYRPSRPGYLYTVAGAGYAWRLSPPSGEGAGGWNAQLGLGYSLRVLKGVNLIVEPAFELNGNRFLSQADDGWRGYYSGFRGTVGLQYRLGRNEALSSLWGRHPWFFTVSGGPVWQVAAASRNGFRASVGFGEKLSDAVSLRISGDWTHAYRKEADNHSAYMALRLDGMVDLLALATGKDLPVGISLLGGPEAGRILVDEPSLMGPIGFLKGQVFYVGASAGMQVRTRIYRRISAFVEPRASFIPYVGIDEENGARNRVDVVFSGNLGLQYDFRTREERRAAWKRLYPRLNLFAGLEGSYFRPLSRDFASGPLASLALGGWFNPRNGLMFQASLGYFQDLRYGNGYVKSSEYSAAYLFHLTNYLRGTETSHPINLSLMAGAGYMLPIKEKWAGSVVFRTGLDLRMHLLRQTDLVARPEIDLLNTPAGKWTPALRGSFGLSYSMGGREDARFSGGGKGWYAILGAGVQQEVFRLSGEALEEAPLGEYRVNMGVGKMFSDRLDWRVSASYLSQFSSDQSSFAHRLRFASVSLDALYDLLGTGATGQRWKLSLVAGPEVGFQHRAITGENSKGSGIILGRQTVSAYIGASGGLQVKYRFTEALSAYLEPKYSVVPYVARTSRGDENYYSHLYGASFGLEYAFVRERSQGQGYQPEASAEEYPRNWFFQLTGTAFSPFGRGYANGPVVSLAAGRWLGSRHGVMLDAGAGYFRDNVNPPQHMAMGEVRASYLFRIRRLVSLMGGIGYLLPEVKQAEKGTFSAHLGFDIRMPLLGSVDLVAQPQLEVFRDPHNVVQGSREGIASAFRGTVGLRYNLYQKGTAPQWIPNNRWYVSVSGGYQSEQGQYADAAGTEFSHNEYRLAVSLGVQYSPALSVRATGSYSKIFPQEGSFLHSLRYTSANLDILYDLLADENGPQRLSLSLLAGPEGGFFNKSVFGEGSESPMRLPIRIGPRIQHSVGAYIGLSAGAQLKVRVGSHVSLYLEQRYSLIPYVQVFSKTDHRNASSHLWNSNLGLQYSFGGK